MVKMASVGAALCFLLAGDLDAEEPALEARRERAIARGVAYLEKHRTDRPWRGTFGPMFSGGQTGTEAMMTLYALAAAGRGNEDSSQRGAAWIQTNPDAFADKTDTVAYRLMVLLDTQPTAARTTIKALHARLVAQRRGKGGWALDLEDSRFGGRSSQFAYVYCTALAVLALSKAERQAGLRTPRRVWRSTARWLREAQKDNGSWGRYPHDERVHTPLGLGALVISAEHARIGPKTLEEPIRRALACLRRYPLERGRNHFYYLLRVAEADRVLRLNNDVWFDAGSRFLIDRQRPDGSWSHEGPRIHTDFRTRPEFDAGPAYHTAIAVYFLSRETARPERERWPDLDPDAADLSDRLKSAFSIYRHHMPVRRILSAARFARVVNQAVAYLLPLLNTADPHLRADAWELLRRVAAPSVSFDPRASDEHRATALKALRAWCAGRK